MLKRNATIYRGVKDPDLLINLTFLYPDKWIPVWLGRSYPKNILLGMQARGVIVMALENPGIRFNVKGGYFIVKGVKYYDIETARQL